MPELSDYEQLNPLERGKLFKRVKEEENLSYKEFGEKIGKSASFVANSIRLLDLPIAIKDGLMGGVVSEGHARALASLDSLNDCIAVYKEVLRSHSTVRETEEMVREAKKKRLSKRQISEKQAQKLKSSIEKILHLKVKKIEVQPSTSKIELTIFPIDND